MAISTEIEFRFRDILKAPRIALSGKGILAQGKPLAYGYLLYLIFSYLALLADGYAFQDIWQRYSFFPIWVLELSAWYSWAIWITGICLLFGFFDYGNLTVSKLAFEELKGNLFFARSKAQVDARGNLRQMWVAGGLLVMLILVLALLQGVVSLVGLIPVVGELIYAVLYAFPFILWALFLVFLTFGLVTSVLTLPAIVVAREKDTFGATFYIFNVIWSQPLRWFGMTAVGLALAKIGMFVLGYFFMRALQLTNFLGELFGGDKIQSVIAGANRVLLPGKQILDFITSLYPGSSITYEWIQYAPLTALSTSESAAAVMIAIALFLVLLTVVTYGINTVTCSQLLAFLHVVYKQDGIRLTDDPSLDRNDPREIIPEKPDGPPASSTIQ
jgi:hypothetical protein